jgi:hypothetical protein
MSKNYQRIKKEFDFEALVTTLDIDNGHYKTAKRPYGDDIDLSSDIQQSVDQMMHQWNSGGYFDNDSVEWINFYPNTHFDKSYVDDIAAQLKVTPKNVWISTIRPGKCVPYHWDIETESGKWAEEGKLVRYTVFLSKPEIGQVFIVGDNCFHMISQGTVYRWDKWNEYHLGFNCGFNVKHVMHIVGIE